MEFEFDERKSESNRAKHGIDFFSVQELWLDGMGIELPARDAGEPRWVAIGKIKGQHWAAFFTVRENRVRIISARRARPKEVAAYEGQGS